MKKAYLNKDDERQMVTASAGLYDPSHTNLFVVAVAKQTHDNRFVWISRATGRSGRTRFPTSLEALKAAAKSLRFQLVLDDDNE